jgi:hypothetical protein
MEQTSLCYTEERVVKTMLPQYLFEGDTKRFV